MADRKRHNTDGFSGPNTATQRCAGDSQLNAASKCVKLSERAASFNLAKAATPTDARRRDFLGLPAPALYKPDWRNTGFNSG